MPALIQICIVIVTVGLLAIVLMTVRMMTRFNRATEELSGMVHAVRESAVQFSLVAQDTRALVASVQVCVPPVLRVVDRFEAVGQRTADLSSTILAELELPAYAAAAVARGVRSGADYFLRRLIRRFSHRSSPTDGDDGNE